MRSVIFLIKITILNFDILFRIPLRLWLQVQQFGIELLLVA